MEAEVANQRDERGSKIDAFFSFGAATARWGPIRRQRRYAEVIMRVKEGSVSRKRRPRRIVSAAPEGTDAGEQAPPTLGREDGPRLKHRGLADVLLTCGTSKRPRNPFFSAGLG